MVECRPLDGCVHNCRPCELVCVGDVKAPLRLGIQCRTGTVAGSFGQPAEVLKFNGAVANTAARPEARTQDDQECTHKYPWT